MRPLLARTNVAQLLTRAGVRGGQVVERSSGDYVVRFSTGREARQGLGALKKRPELAYVEANRLVHPAAKPNDPLLNYQWHHRRLESESAWQFNRGDGDPFPEYRPIVAVVDTGIQVNHPDLASQLVSGYNAVTDLAQSSGGQIGDVNGHGTQVAGIIGARANNGVGLSGICWNIPLMPIRVTNNANGSATLADISAGIHWAADHGARIINVSMDGVDSATAEAAGQYAWDKGALVVWSAGNQGLQLNNDWPHVLVVGATDPTDAISSNSNTGQAIDLVAPGTNLYTTKIGSAYGVMSGTSGSSAIVSGVAATMLCDLPRLNVADLNEYLLASTKDLGSTGEDNVFGSGRIDPRKALVSYPIYQLAISQTIPSGNLFVQGSGVGYSGQFEKPYNTNYVGSPVQLPLPGGYPFGAALDASFNLSTIVGFASTDNYDPTAAQPLRWVNGVATLLDKADGSDGYAVGVNDSGLMVGAVHRPIGYRAAKWNQAGVISWLAEPPSTYDTEALGINGLGQSVGTVYVLNPDPPFSQGVIWNSSGQVEQVVDVPDAWYVTLRSIGADGTAVGEALVADDEVPFGVFGSLATQLPTPAGQPSGRAITCINENAIGGWVGPNYYDPSIRQGALWLKKRFLDPNEYLQPPFSSGSITTVKDIRSVISPWPDQIDVDYTEPGGRVRPGSMSLVLRDLGQGGLTVNCGVQFQGLVADPSTKQLTVELLVFGEVVESRTGSYSAFDDTFQFDAGRTGIYDVRVLSPHYLSRVLPDVQLQNGSGGEAAFNVTLLPGDIDLDNVVSVFDYIALSDAFDSTPGDTAWNASADLDGDDVVSIFDYILLSDNFDKEGE